MIQRAAPESAHRVIELAWCVVVALGLGALCGLGRSGTGLGFVHLAALCVWANWCARARSPSLAMMLGIGLGCGECLVVLIGSASWGGVVPVVGTLGSLGVYYLPLAFWIWWIARSSNRGLRVLGTVCFAAILCQGSEWVGLPRRTITVLMDDFRFVAWGARLVGADLVSGLIDATILEVALWFSREGEPKRSLPDLLAGASPGFFLLVGLATLGRLSAPSGTKRVVVGIPQINADSRYHLGRLLDEQIAREFDARFREIIRHLEGVDLLVTTEAYDGRYGLSLPAVVDQWSAYSQRNLQAGVVTSYVVGPAGEKFNAAGVFDGSGHLIGVQRKIDLAPFGESPLSPGETRSVFEALPGVHLGVEICLESYLRHPGVELTRRGANLLVATTSDGTFGSSVLVFEHLSNSRLHAIELGRSIVWASNAGPSGVIDRFGRFEGGPFRAAAAVRQTAAVHGGLTPYVRLSVLWWLLPWVGWSGVLLALRREGSEKQVLVELSRSRAMSGWSWASIPVVAFCFFAAPNLVDWSHDRPMRGWESVSEFWAPVVSDAAAGDYSGYANTADRSADSAVLYFLRYFGHPLDNAPTLPSRATREEVRTYLAARNVPLRSIDLSRVDPRVAVLLRLKSGVWAVADSMEPGVFRLVAPHEARVGELTLQQLLRLAEPQGFIPHSEALSSVL